MKSLKSDGYKTGDELRVIWRDHEVRVRCEAAAIAKMPPTFNCSWGWYVMDSSDGHYMILCHSCEWDGTKDKYLDTDANDHTRILKADIAAVDIMKRANGNGRSFNKARSGKRKKSKA